MAKSTRFATTVVTRNLVTPQGFDGFYLDGRISGPRDTRGGDITLDREDRGFFYALFSNNGSDIKQVALRNKKHLDSIFEDMKIENRYNIDYEINELAECAVNIAGRLTLTDNQLPPYFAGLVVKDGEMAAITSGRGCAYLYRNDILYPLTNDEYPLSDVDLNGKKVPNLNLYCAGLAGIIRYSNIAQLQPDDCFVLCNREVMETLGHHNVLKILADSYDQQDASCRVVDEMARRNPGVTAQFMIGFVENITTLDKVGLKSLTGRTGWTQKTLKNMGGLAGLENSTYLNNQPTDVPMAPVSAAAPTMAPPISEQPVATPGFIGQTAPIGEENQYQQYQQPQYNQQPQYAQQPMNQQMPQYQPAYSQQPEFQRSIMNHNLIDAVEDEGLSTTRKVIIGIMIALIVLLGSFLVYLAAGGKIPGMTTPSSERVEVSKPRMPAVITPSTLPKVSNHLPIRLTDPSTKVSNSIKITNNEDVKTTTSTTKPNTTPTTTQTTNKPNTSTKPSADAGSGSSGTYVVKEGDTVWGIAMDHKGNTDINDYIEKIINANPKLATSDKKNLDLHPGDKVILPKP